MKYLFFRKLFQFEITNLKRIFTTCKYTEGETVLWCNFYEFLLTRRKPFGAQIFPTWRTRNNRSDWSPPAVTESVRKKNVDPSVAARRGMHFCDARAPVHAAERLPDGRSRTNARLCGALVFASAGAHVRTVDTTVGRPHAVGSRRRAWRRHFFIFILFFLKVLLK